MTTTKKEEKLNIQELSVSLKERNLYIAHTPTALTKSGKLLGKVTTEEGNQRVHKDVINALQCLVPHMLMIVEMPGFRKFTDEYLENEEAVEDNNLKGFYVTGFSISAKGGLTIKGGVKTESGRVTTMNAPLTSLDAESSNYEHIDDLNSIIETLIDEATKYFIDGKFGEGAQTDAFNQQKEEPASQEK